jgi:hypothetical protein
VAVGLLQGLRSLVLQAICDTTVLESQITEPAMPSSARTFMLPIDLLNLFFVID